MNANTELKLRKITVNIGCRELEMKNGLFTKMLKIVRYLLFINIMFKMYNGSSILYSSGQWNMTMKNKTVP